MRVAPGRDVTGGSPKLTDSASPEMVICDLPSDQQRTSWKRAGSSGNPHEGFPANQVTSAVAGSRR